MDMKDFYSPETLAMMKDAIVAELNEKYGEKKNDPVHPSHYKLPGGMEVIDVEVAMFGKEWVQHHCICTAVEYLLRHRQKNGAEDVKKAKWWIDEWCELAEDSTNE